MATQGSLLLILPPPLGTGMQVISYYVTRSNTHIQHQIVVGETKYPHTTLNSSNKGNQIPAHNIE